MNSCCSPTLTNQTVQQARKQIHIKNKQNAESKLVHVGQNFSMLMLASCQKANPSQGQIQLLRLIELSSESSSDVGELAALSGGVLRRANGFAPPAAALS